MVIQVDSTQEGETKKRINPKNRLQKNFDIAVVGDLSWGWTEGSLFNSYYTEM